LLGWQEKFNVTQFEMLLASFSVKPFLVRVAAAILEVWRECFASPYCHACNVGRHPFCVNLGGDVRANWTVIYPLGGKSLTDAGRYD
jgi:hypothetical protein